MTRSLAALAAVLLRCLVMQAQSDSIRYSRDLPMPDGVYLSYDDFRHNRAITRQQIISDIDKSQLEFIGKALYQEDFKFKRNDSVITRKSVSAWGFFQNNTLYVNYKDDFYRIPVFGSISYLVATVIVQNTGFYDPRFGYPSSASSTREIREFLMNFYDGLIIESNLGNLEELLARDKELFEEFTNLSKRKQKDQLYSFIRRFNEKHPVYFLKG
jgi:hypothetical protein